MDFQGLIGNVGGYIGLCLGYSILQIPDFIPLLVFKLKKHFGTRHRMHNNQIGFTPPITEKVEKMVQTQSSSHANLSNSDNDDLVNSLRLDVHEIKIELDKLREYVHQTKL